MLYADADTLWQRYFSCIIVLLFSCITITSFRKFDTCYSTDHHSPGAAGEHFPEDSVGAIISRASAVSLGPQPADPGAAEEGERSFFLPVNRPKSLECW